MEAGRELDALIAQKVFGYTLDYEFADMMFDGTPCVKELRDGYDEWGILPSYSTDIGDAWLIVDHMRALGWRFHLSEYGDMVWNCRFTPEDTSKYQYDVAILAPLAICRAALKAIDDHNQH